MKRLLLDTHIVIRMATEPDLLPPLWIEAIRDAETRFISHVTAWEIQIKHEKFGDRFNFSLGELARTMRTLSCTELPIELEDIHKLDALPFIHADPFDRMLIAQASRRGFTLVTLDRVIIQTHRVSKVFDLLTDPMHR